MSSGSHPQPADENVLRSVAGVLIATAALLSLPLLASQVTDEVAWSLADFAVAGVLLAGTGLLLLLIGRKTARGAYRWAAGLAVVTALMLIWANLAVGVIGSEGNPANLMYVGVLAVGAIGALAARFRPRGMARAMIATAVVQAVVALIALVAGLGAPANGPLEILGGNGLFVALWIGSALLFRSAARGSPGDRRG